MTNVRRSSRLRPGTGREYLIGRLEKGGHRELLAAVRADLISAYAAACEVGIVKRPRPLGSGSLNQRRRREFAISRALVDGC
jgi:hypothetical protein